MNFESNSRRKPRLNYNLNSFNGLKTYQVYLALKRVFENLQEINNFMDLFLLSQVRGEFILESKCDLIIREARRIKNDNVPPVEPCSICQNSQITKQTRQRCQMDGCQDSVMS